MEECTVTAQFIRVPGKVRHVMFTVNVEMFTQYIFSRISHRVLDARKFDESEIIVITEKIELTVMCATMLYMYLEYAS